jgi:hypothetical protein
MRSLALALLIPAATFALPPTLGELPADFLTDRDAGTTASELRGSRDTLIRLLRLFRTTPEPGRKAILRGFRQAAQASEDVTHRADAAWMTELLEKLEPIVVRYLRVDDLDERGYARALRQAKVTEHFRERRGFLRRRTHLVLSGKATDLDAFTSAAGYTVEVQEDIQGLEVHVKYRNSHDPGNLVRERIMEYAYVVRPDINEGLTWLRILPGNPAGAVCSEVNDGRFEMPYRRGRGSVGKVTWEVRLPHDPEPIAEGDDGGWYACKRR